MTHLAQIRFGAPDVVPNETEDSKHGSTSYSSGSSSSEFEGEVDIKGLDSQNEVLSVCEVTSILRDSPVEPLLLIELPSEMTTEDIGFSPFILLRFSLSSSARSSSASYHRLRSFRVSEHQISKLQIYHSRSLLQLIIARKLYFFLHTAQEILNNHFLNEMGPETLSSMDMKLQELLNEVRLNESSVKTLDEFVTVICDSIRSIPDDTIKVTSESIPKFISDIGAPTEKIRFTFRTPKVVEVAGSHSIQAVTKPEVNVDLLIRMPKECFYEKDYLNHQYHARRCLYLFVIEEHLKRCSLIRKVEWSTFQNEARKPVLLLFLDTKDPDLSDCFIRLIPTCTSLFDISRLSLTRNNVRSVTEGGVSQATPVYNSSILEDMFLEENAIFLKKIFFEYKGLQHALVLLKVWARQRSTICSHDCLNGFLLSIIVSHLASGFGENRITMEMGAWQIFRVTINFIATTKLWNKGIFIQHPHQRVLSKEDRKMYLQLFAVVLHDVSGCVNLAFRMTKSALAELQDEARMTLTCIAKNQGDGGFEEIFMTKIDFPTKFDYCVRINLKENKKIRDRSFCLDNEFWKICEQEVFSLLERALSDRAKLVRVIWKSTPSKWDISDGFTKFMNEPMFIGVMISSCEKGFRVVDIGPNAEKKTEAIDFRKFWGDKAELRRFKDGNIAESTVWNSEQWERHLIIKRITEFILCKHLLVLEEDMTHVSGQLDFCLFHGGRDPISFSSDMLASFEILSKRLRLLDDIPLRVSSVQPIDPAFRHTSVFPPEPHPLAYGNVVDLKSLKLALRCVKPLEVMIQLEGSGNWPLDDKPLEKTKSAFLLKIGESLQSRWEMFCTASENEVNVLVSGYAFSLKILHERALNFFKSTVGNGKIRGVTCSDKDLYLRSQHSSMINGLNGCYPTYGSVVRLAKRWISSHLFSSFLVGEAVELLVAYLFVKPFPFTTPCSRVTGFLRFLRFLANYDWIFSPLIVDINNDLSCKDEQEINANFKLSRKSYEANQAEPAMFLATSYDKSSEAWTKISPKMIVLKRLISYARSSAELLSTLILQGQTGAYTWECLFRTPLNHFDAVVLLHQDKLAYPQRLLFPSEMNQGTHVIKGSSSNDFHSYIPLGISKEHFEQVRDKLMVNFDPTRCYVEDLKLEFPGLFKLWYDSLGGDAIGLTWEKMGGKKRDREETDEGEREAIESLKSVAEKGKGFVRSVYLLKASKVHS